jgi:DNA-binding NtrC family response regulator
LIKSGEIRMRAPLLDACFAPRELLAVGDSTAPVNDDGRFGKLMLILGDGRRVSLRRAVTIGTARDNDLQIEDDHASRRHCVIEPHERRVVVRDLESTNGTLLNGVRVSQAELRPGTLLTLGSTRLRVMRDDAMEVSILGNSQPIVQLRQEVTRLASAPLPVLIQGETGTGKELVARALHDQSGRRGQFVPVNCGSIPRELIESELFGHERGAFTGASARRRGLFQEADAGTLFLDEIGELPELLQTRLLRALETGVVRPVGAMRDVHVHVRVVAATHVDLERAVETSRFRRDLYYRLEGARLTTPPLRTRREDIPLLAQQMLDEQLALGFRCKLSPAAMEALQEHTWPGNVRELKNVLRRAATLGGAVLEPQDLMLDIARRRPGDPERVEIGGRTYQEIERDILVRTLRRCQGNQRAAAAELDMARSSLNDKLRRYGVDPASMKSDL